MYCYTISSVWIFSWFYYPQSTLTFMFFGIFEVVFGELFPSLVFIFFDVESDRQVIKYIFTLLLVVSFHVIV